MTSPSAELVPSLPGSVATSRLHTPAASLSGSCFVSSPIAKRVAQGLEYSFINAEFIEESPVSHPQSTASFRNLTSTPRHSHPLSLPQSLPLDWNLFNKQFELQQRRKQARLKRKLGEVELENNFENLPYHVIDFIADCVESQNDLINLSLTCKFFNKMVNKRLYSKLIFVDDISEKCMHYDGDYTLVDGKNYPKLLASLHSNEELVQLIKEIVIDTSSNNASYDSLCENIYSALYDLFLTTNNNLKVLENLDYSNLKKFNSLVRYNSDHLIKHNYNKYTYFYSSTENMEDLIRNDLLHLKNFQLLDLNDLNKLPFSTRSVSVVVEHEHNLNDAFKLQIPGYRVLQGLQVLKLHTSTAYETFINEMYAMMNTPNAFRVQRLENIRTLSIANIHRSEDHTRFSHLSFHKLSTVIDLSQVEELEIKTRCLDTLCNSCVLQFLMEWYECLLQYNKSKLKKVSIISLPPNSNKNVGIQWDAVLNNKEFLEKFGENLEFFFINLNDFPFVPLFEKTEALEVNDSQKLPINKEILRTRKMMYSNILSSFKKLQLLVIPDYFYNWAVYNNITDLTSDDNLNFLNFLNTCHCSSCCSSRELFLKYSKQHQFKDFKGRFKTSLHYSHDKAQRYNRLTDPDPCRLLYNYIIRELKSRIPLKQLNKVQSSLEYDKFVPNVRSNPVIPQEDFMKMTRLFTHGLRPQVQRLLQELPELRKFNLGGILYKCFSTERGKVRVHCVYDEFEEVFSRR